MHKYKRYYVMNYKKSKRGKPLSEVRTLTNKAVTEALDGLPAHKIHCSVLAEEAIKSALEDYENRKTAGNQ